LPEEHRKRRQPQGGRETVRVTPSPTTMPFPKLIGSRSPAEKPTPRPTGVGARTPKGLEITP
jgi:hypothetical protein